MSQCEDVYRRHIEARASAVALKPTTLKLRWLELPSGLVQAALRHGAVHVNKMSPVLTSTKLRVSKLAYTDCFTAYGAVEASEATIRGTWRFVNAALYRGPNALQASFDHIIIDRSTGFSRKQCQPLPGPRSAAKDEQASGKRVRG